MGTGSVWEDELLEVDGGDGPDVVKMDTRIAGRERSESRSEGSYLVAPSQKHS